MLPAARLAHLVAQCRTGACPVVDVERVDETGSTNLDLLDRAATLRAPLLLVAGRQAAGRGRAGRAWDTQDVLALTFSLAWPWPAQYAPSSLSLAVGVVIAEVLREQGVAVQLKWPNDVLRDGAKLGGILIETTRVRTGPEPRTWVVAGVGLNLQVPQALAVRLGRAVADLHELLPVREALLASVAGRLADLLATFPEEGLAPYVRRWETLHAYAGQRVTVTQGQQVLHAGMTDGIDHDGRLLLRTPQGTVAVAAGDVSLRLDEQEEVMHAVAD